MLLPPAFACEGSQQPQLKPQRPKLPSFTTYQPQCLSSPSRQSPLSSTCRALHAILGAPAAIPPPGAIPPLELGNPFMPSGLPTMAPRIPQPPPRSAHKRRRSEFERDLAPASQSSDVVMEDCQRTPQLVRTPKRRRRIPLSMPMGLSADDFRALETPVEEEEELALDMPIVSPLRAQSDYDSAYGSSPSLENPEWTTEDDRMLVETVLEKMKLSKRDWNDCARKLGRDKDSLGSRWTLLVGEGNVGLRRGGRISRPNLDITSW